LHNKKPFQEPYQKKNNILLSCATVLIAGTSSGTTNAFDGKFQFNVNTGNVEN
jgi:hypothetical protein